jgi:hypothetical protein
VVGVHGIAKEQLGMRQLLDPWTVGLQDGLEKALGRPIPDPDLAIAFYGDLFLSAADEGLGDDRPNLLGQPDPMSASSLAVTVTVTERSDDVSDEDLGFLESAAAEAELNRPDLGEEMGFIAVPKILQPLVRHLSRRFDARLVLPFLSVLRQVRLYQQDDALAEQIRNRVLSTIGDGCPVLLGHSLGSVVAFETLALHPDLAVDTLVTCGSPLSMRTVADGLRGRPGPGRLPGQIRRWVNIYDPADPVAGAGAVSRLWTQAEDYEVHNGDEPHAIIRYLSKKITGRTIAETGNTH